VTNHRFRLNGVDHWVNFTEAGTQWGCTTKVRTRQPQSTLYTKRLLLLLLL
jgi:hypothetical protein